MRLTSKHELAGPVENGLKREKEAKEIDSKKNKLHCRPLKTIGESREVKRMVSYPFNNKC